MRSGFLRDFLNNRFNDKSKYVNQFHNTDFCDWDTTYSRFDSFSAICSSDIANFSHYEIDTCMMCDVYTGFPTMSLFNHYYC
jgi:hypothetical protein